MSIEATHRRMLREQHFQQPLIHFTPLFIERELEKNFGKGFPLSRLKE